MVEMKKATKDDIHDMRGNMNKIEHTFQRVREMTTKLSKISNTDVRIRTYERLNTRVQDEIDEYNKNKNRYEFMCNQKNAIISNSGIDNTSNAASFNDRDSDVPIMKVYDQTEFVEKRQGDILKLNEDARLVNDLAGNINKKIYDQDDKLDGINKKMGDQVDVVKAANQELHQAETISNRRNKSTMCWILFIIGLSAILVASIYYLFK